MLVVNSFLRKLLTMTRHRTIDRAQLQVLTTSEIGPKRARTPEGFLLCQDVPAARVGEMIYGPGEVPLEPGADYLIRVERGADELFDPKTLASYVGKPVVNDHPDDDVNPKNWKQLAVGLTLNPRRGEGQDSDVMLVDLLITDQEAIRDVEAGKREVSAGYEADYEQIAPGRGRQTNIIGNHIALVERGRCGPRCAIGDSQPKELQGMATKNQRAAKRRTIVADAIRKAFQDAEESLTEGLAEAPGLDDDESGDTHIHIHAGDGTMGASGAPNGTDPNIPGGEGGPKDITQDDPIEMRFQSLEAGHKELNEKLDKLLAAQGGGGAPEGGAPAGGVPEELTAKDGLPEEVEEAIKSKTADSLALETSFKAVLSDAEILVPGFRLPTFDAKAKRKSTMDAMCSLRRGVLTHISATATGGELLKAVGGDKVKFADATCAEVANVFRSAAGAQRLINNSAATRDASRTPQPTGARPVGGVKTLADLNKLHATVHAGK